MIVTILSSVKGGARRMLHSPFGFQAFSLTILLVFMLGFRPNYFLSMYEPFVGEDWEKVFTTYPVTEEGFIDNFAGVSTAGLREILMEDENGNMVVQLEPKKRSKIIKYTVKSGETTFDIAHKFGLKVSTITWANKLTARQLPQVGNLLIIPPTDGIFYAVQNGDTLERVAKNHNVDMEKIMAYNIIKNGNTLTLSQELFIPGAQKVYVEAPPAAEIAIAGETLSGGLGAIGFKLRRPTQGVLTQGYHSQHFAIDIANRMNTPIYASASGKVIKSSDGWNYGYGRYIVIDHGNGIETLYAHNNVRKVEVGDEVKTGQLIGLMGNTGNVWGPTGIHIHFEVRIRGRKVNPFNYF